MQSVELDLNDQAVFDAKRPRRRVLLYVCRAPLGVAAPGGQAAAGAVLVKRFAHPQ